MDGLEARGEGRGDRRYQCPEGIDPALRRPGRFDQRDRNWSAPMRLVVFKYYRCTPGHAHRRDVRLEDLARYDHGLRRCLTSPPIKKKPAMHRTSKDLPEIDLKRDSQDVLDKLQVTAEDLRTSRRTSAITMRGCLLRPERENGKERRGA